MTNMQENIKQQKNIEKILFNKNPDNFNKDAYVEQYKLLLDSTERNTDRRQTANSYFLTLNTGVCAILGYILSKDAVQEIKYLYWILPIAGILLSIFWHRLVTSYRQLSTAKFDIIHQVEAKLPFSIYKAEWIALGEGKDKKIYVPVTNLEIWIPKLFIAMYSLLLVYFTSWLHIKGIFQIILELIIK